MNRPTILGFVGDLMLGRGVSAALPSSAPDSFWGDVLPILHSADAVLGNLECPITIQQTEWKRCWKAFRFRADPHAVDVLRTGNIRFVTLANNHILDFETNGLLDTLQHLQGAGIAHAGAGRDSLEALRPAVFEVNGLRIGVIAMTDNMREFAARPDSAGTNFMRIRCDHMTLGLIASELAALRKDGVQIVVLSAHWGCNLRPWPSYRFQAFARAVVDLGVDVFHGHSAHLLHGIERRGNGIILYDTGDFLDDYWVFPFVRTDRSCLFLIDIVGGRVDRIRLVPVMLFPGRVQLARGRHAQIIAARMLRSSLAFAAAGDAGTVELSFECAHRPEVRRATEVRLADAESCIPQMSIADFGRMPRTLEQT